MKKNLLFWLSALGIVAGLVAAYVFGLQRKPEPPLFQPVGSPYASAIYANGIIEGAQDGGTNVNVYPEVAGTVVRLLVREGQAVSVGTPLLALDDSVQRATTAQLRAQADAAQALLAALKAQPRRETLEVARAQLTLAEANLKTARDQDAKRRAAVAIDARALSRDVVDTAADAVLQAEAAAEVARRQLELTQAGAWSYDIRNQESQTRALEQAAQAAAALLDKYQVRARVDGVVLALHAAVGGYVSAQGAYDSTIQALLPVATLVAGRGRLAVRCFVDEILVSRLPPPERIQAQMQIRGTERKVPLRFVRIQPYVSPKIELSNQRQERVDLRVLPVVFEFDTQGVPAVYAGQLVDVYIGAK
ncbi:MAG: biotin/lipoyl-binding protein [Burkholderiales bacterium]|nr:biotin/lipoyl-binding protein [Burkholderiales bacterium]